MTSMLLATFQTPSYTFTVLASTHAEALTALAAAWSTHAGQTGADSGYFDEYREDVQFALMPYGVVLRDGEPLD